VGLFKGGVKLGKLIFKGSNASIIFLVVVFHLERSQGVRWEVVASDKEVGEVSDVIHTKILTGE